VLRRNNNTKGFCTSKNRIKNPRMLLLEGILKSILLPYFTGKKWEAEQRDLPEIL
jgi:hypothetical protein